MGFSAVEVNGGSDNRTEVLQDFDNGKYNVLCNSMLLTEGWDCPSVDCVVVLRPTKVRALYSQMVDEVQDFVKERRNYCFWISFGILKDMSYAILHT